MDNETNNVDSWMGFIIGAIVTAIVVSIMWAADNSDRKRDAIVHGAAQYNPTSGVFEWKTNTVYITNFVTIERK